jgi:hypothetical protein
MKVTDKTQLKRETQQIREICYKYVLIKYISIYYK